MHNEDMFEVEQTFQSAHVVNGDKIIFMWKEIHIKVIDEIKGNSTWEFNPSDKVKAIKDMLKDN